LAEVNAFEFEFEEKVGHLLDRLELLEQEIARYNERIQIVRSREIYGQAHIPVEAQYRRTWQTPRTSAPTPPPEPLPAATEAEIKRLYRQLARRFHPDLAADEADRRRRTDKMQAINDAYAARSMAELIALSDEADDIISIGRPGQARQADAPLAEVLQNELVRIQKRLREIESEIKGLHLKPSVALSLEVKVARSRGQDLLAEAAANLERKIARQEVERDMLKSQFDQLDLDQGFIDLSRYKK
jgi:hypothetical protein